jgi:predicted kinase
LTYLNYLSLSKKNTHRLFGIGGQSINSKRAIITIGEKQIKTTLAQENFAIWFANNKLMEKIIEMHKLFLIPQCFL